MKKIVVLLLVLVTLFSLISCGVDYRVSLDENLHGKVEVLSNNEIMYDNSNLKKRRISQQDFLLFLFFFSENYHFIPM